MGTISREVREGLEKRLKLWPHTIALITVTLVMIATHFGHVYPDSKVYINMTKYFMFKDASMKMPQLIVTRPLVPLIASALSPALGVNFSLSIVNSIFWILSALVFYEWSKIWLGDRDTAFYSSIFYTTAVPMLMIGASVLVDMSAWFFMTLTLYLVEVSRREENLKYHALTGLAIGVGALSKEVVMSLLLYVLLIETNKTLLKKQSIRNGLRKILTVVCFAAIIPSLWLLQFGENLTLYYRIAVPRATVTYDLPYERLYPNETPIIGNITSILIKKISQIYPDDPSIVENAISTPIKILTHFMISFAGAFWLTLPFIPWGLNKAKGQGKIMETICLFIPLAITIALRAYIERRRAFMLFPLIIPMGVSGISTLFGKYKYGNVIMAVLYVITTNIIFLLAPGALLN